MKTLIFEGYSDDTFACTGPGIDVDKDNCGNGKPITMLVSDGPDQMLVIGQYAKGKSDGWGITVAPYDPNNADDATAQIPDWPISISRSNRHYSPRLTITAPDTVAVFLI